MSFHTLAGRAAARVPVSVLPLAGTATFWPDSGLVTSWTLKDSRTEVARLGQLWRGLHGFGAVAWVSADGARSVVVQIGSDLLGEVHLFGPAGSWRGNLVTGGQRGIVAFLAAALSCSDAELEEVAGTHLLLRESPHGGDEF